MAARLSKRELLITSWVLAGGVVVVSAGLLVASQLFALPGSFPQLCSLDRKAVFEGSAIGRNAVAQFAALKAQKQSELISEKNRLEVLARGHSGSEDAQQRIASLQHLVATENSRLEEVRSAVVASVIDSLGATIRQVGDEYKCNSILDRSNFVYVGHTKDLTSETIRKIQQGIRPLPRNFVVEMYAKHSEQ